MIVGSGALPGASTLTAYYHLRYPDRAIGLHPYVSSDPWDNRVAFHGMVIGDGLGYDGCFGHLEKCLAFHGLGMGWVKRGMIVERI